jgi:hypothetical protein
MFDKTYEMQPNFWGTPNAGGCFTCPDFDNFEYAVMLLAVRASSLKNGDSSISYTHYCIR